MPLEPGQSLANYRLIEKIGEGGMGVVWKATDTNLDRDVAIKVLPEVLAADPERLSRFEREAKLLASLNHPNIAIIHGLHEADGIRFLAMELMSGEDLSQRLARGALPIEEALNVGQQVAEALEAAHENNIIHRDLKPANIQLTAEGKVKVLDFGLAKAFAPDASATSGSPSMSPTMTSAGTAVGMILGTAAYMSPEQAKGKPVDRRADIWAFGVVLYEMLVGEKLFHGETISETLAAVLLKEADLSRLPREAPVRVQVLAERCLRKDPKVRLRDIGEARIVLAEQLGGAPASSIMMPSTDVAAPPVSKGRYVVPWVVAVLALIGAVTFGVLFIQSRLAPPRVLRAHIPSPPDTSFHISGISPGPVQVSPDGSQIMFVTSNNEGQRMLWLRHLDAATARPLQGTDGAQYAFWSADNKHVGFFADGKLKKMPAAGGPSLSLADASNGKGGSWSREGNILYAPNYGSGIYLVSAAGGTAKPVTQIDQEAGEDSHRHPHFLPDGRHFLYVARHGGGFGREEQGGHPVKIGSIEGDEPRELFKSESNVSYAMGHLLFVRENTLMARPFDTDSRELTGDAFPLAEGVVFLPGAVVGYFSSSENGVLSYLTGEAQARSRLVWWDAEGNEMQSFGEYSNLALGRISPDQRHIAYMASETESANYDIWIYEIARGVRSRFTFHGGFDSNPTWSPDGRQIAFSSTREGHQDLFVKPFTGSGEVKPLFVSEKDKMPTDWSPDGKLLSFFEVDPNGVRDLWLLPLDGEKEPYSLTQSSFADGWGRFSPDGKWYAYNSNESGTFEIYVRYLPEPGRKWQISTHGGGWPAWRQDGEEIYYYGLDGQIMAVEVIGEGDNFQVGTPRALFGTDISPSTSFFPLYDVSRDGKRFLLQRPMAANEQDPLTLVINWPATIPQP